MQHRMFQVIETGQWCAAVLSREAFTKPEIRTVVVERIRADGLRYEAEEQHEVDVPDDGTAYADAIAADLGLLPGALRVVDVDDGQPDPRTGALLAPAPSESAAAAQPPEPVILTALRGA